MISLLLSMIGFIILFILIIGIWDWIVGFFTVIGWILAILVGGFIIFIICALVAGIVEAIKEDPPEERKEMLLGCIGLLVIAGVIAGIIYVI